MLKELYLKKQARLPEKTSAFRVFDGTGAYPNVFIDRLGENWLISTRNCEVPLSFLKELRGLGDPIYHKALDKDNKLSPQLIFGEEKDGGRFLIQEQGVNLWLDMKAGYSQGLFLDQRDNRAWVRSLIKPGMTVLNTFSYTGAFSVYAATCGAQTTTLDLAQPCLDWAKENMEANAIDPTQQYFCKGDTLHWLKRFAKQKRTFDVIVLDPPTFSRDKDGKVWRVERDYGKLARLAYDCLSLRGKMLCTTNCRKLSHAEFLTQLKKSLPVGTRFEQVRMPFDFDGEDYLKIVRVFS